MKRKIRKSLEAFWKQALYVQDSLNKDLFENDQQIQLPGSFLKPNDKMKE